MCIFGQLRIQQRRPSDAISLLQKCLRAQSDPAELLAVQRENEEARRLELQAYENANEELDDEDDDQDEPEMIDEEDIDYFDEEQEEDITDDGDLDLVIIAVPINICFQSSPPGATCVSHSQMEADQGVVKFFDHAFVTTCLDCEDSTFEACPQFIRAIVLFNMAVCLHQQSRVQRTKALVAAATRAYSLALEALTGYAHPGRLEDVMLLRLALQNNLADVYAQLSQIDMAQRCVGQIQSLLRTSMKQIRHRHRPLAPSYAELLSFWITTFTMPEHLFVTAGAA